ncbi:hypothetical protein D3C86_2155800 [compost metagenome]
MIGDFHEAIRPLEDFRLCHALPLYAAESLRFGVGGFLDADIAYSARRRSEQQGQI